MTTMGSLPFSLGSDCPSCDQPTTGGMCVVSATRAYSLMMPPGLGNNGGFCPVQNMAADVDSSEKKCEHAPPPPPI